MKVVDQDLNLECWGPEHFKWTLAITIPSLLFWGVLVPLLAMVILMRHKDKLFSYKMKSRYGWLYEGLDSSSYCWEFFIAYRKIVLIILSVFFVDIGDTIAVNINFTIFISFVLK